MKVQKFQHRISGQVKTKSAWLKVLAPIVRDFAKLGYRAGLTTEEYFKEKVEEETLIPMEV